MYGYVLLYRVQPDAASSIGMQTSALDARFFVHVQYLVLVQGYTY